MLIRKDPERNLIRRSDLFFTHFKEIRVFTKAPVNWLTLGAPLLPFLHYNYLSSGFCGTEEMLFESFISLLDSFFKKPKADFKIVASHIEIFAVKNFELVEEMLPSRVGDLHSEDQFPLLERLKGFRNFVVLRPRTRNNPFIQKLGERGVPMVEIDRQGPDKRVG